MANQADVIRIHDKHPEWTAAEIARWLGCSAAYVRATGQRKNLTFAGSKPKPVTLSNGSDHR